MSTHANINVSDGDRRATITMLSDGYPDSFAEILRATLEQVQPGQPDVSLVDAFFPKGTPIDPCLDRERFPIGLGDSLYRYDLERSSEEVQIATFRRQIDPEARPSMQGWDEVFRGTVLKFHEWATSIRADEDA